MKRSSLVLLSCDAHSSCGVVIDVSSGLTPLSDINTEHQIEKSTHSRYRQSGVCGVVDVIQKLVPDEGQ